MVAVIDGGEHVAGTGDCLIVPAGTAFSLHVAGRRARSARDGLPARRRAGDHAAATAPTFRPALGRVSEPDLAILITAANRCLADRLGAAVATVGGEAMRPSFGFVIRAVAAEQPTVSRLAELLGVSKQAASRLADDMVGLGYLERAADPRDRRRTGLRLSRTGERIRARALAESHAMEAELAERFGPEADVGRLRALLIDLVERRGGGRRAGRAASVRERSRAERQKPGSCESQPRRPGMGS